MQSSLFEPGRPVLVVVCIARKLRPCPSYSRRRDRINLGLWRSLYKGGGYIVGNFIFQMCAKCATVQNKFVLKCSHFDAPPPRLGLVRVLFPVALVGKWHLMASSLAVFEVSNPGHGASSMYQ